LSIRRERRNSEPLLYLERELSPELGRDIVGDFLEARRKV